MKKPRGRGSPTRGPRVEPRLCGRSLPGYAPLFIQPQGRDRANPFCVRVTRGSKAVRPDPYDPGRDSERPCRAPPDRGLLSSAGPLRPVTRIGAPRGCVTPPVATCARLRTRPVRVDRAVPDGPPEPAKQERLHWANTYRPAACPRGSASVSFAQPDSGTGPGPSDDYPPGLPGSGALRTPLPPSVSYRPAACPRGSASVSFAQPGSGTCPGQSEVSPPGLPKRIAPHQPELTAPPGRLPPWLGLCELRSAGQWLRVLARAGDSCRACQAGARRATLAHRAEPAGHAERHTVRM